MCEYYIPALTTVFTVFIGTPISTVISEWITGKILERGRRKKHENLRAEEDAEVAHLKDTSGDTK